MSSSFTMHGARDAVANNLEDFEYTKELIDTLEQNVANRSRSAFDISKSLIENVCKTILKEQSVEFGRKDLPALFRMVVEKFFPSPSDANKKMLNGLHTAVNNICNLRIQCGHSHGGTGELQRPAIGTVEMLFVAETTDVIASFLLRTHQRHKYSVEGPWLAQKTSDESEPQIETSWQKWAQDNAATELAIAMVLGSWADKSDADRATVEDLSGNPYGEWIGKMRKEALRPGTPLINRDGNWKFVARYEGWYELGPLLSDDHLEKLQAAAFSVLTEKDPQFELPSEQRYASSIYGKVFTHSKLLRKGLAESLALLGSHPKTLKSCTPDKAKKTAVLSVHSILADAGWERWAGLNDLLPLLAEAAPGEFLDAIEKALKSEPCPFDQVFAQEGEGVMGCTYMAGLLWALETLAWDANHLVRVVVCLGGLASRDPGGNWANRPANSLTHILLPWLTQTCAPVAKRKVAVKTLLDEIPDIGWKLLVSLLPRGLSTSSETHRPVWREIIPNDWSQGVTDGEYREQIKHYSEMAITAAKRDCEKLAVLIDHMKKPPSPVYEQLLAHLGSSTVVGMPETDRLDLWAKLVDLVTRHRKFSDTEWAMKPEQVNEIASVAERLAPDTPMLRHQRLFNEDDSTLSEEKGNYKDQGKNLEIRLQKAVEEVATDGGTQAVLAFATTVQSPWRVGNAFGALADLGDDEEVLPGLLGSEEKALTQLVDGFVGSRFRLQGWQWVDDIDTAQWTPAQIGQFLAFLPFGSETWKRSKHLLGKNEAAYWSRVNPFPYDADTGLKFATDQLLQHGRPRAALRCLGVMLHRKQSLNGGQAVRALLETLESSERTGPLDNHYAVRIIEALQDDPDPDVSPDDVSRVEWAYLQLLLDHDDKASPKLLEKQLATKPSFFCEVIRLIFRSDSEKKGERPPEEPTEERKNMATNAYRLLRKWRTPPGCRADGTYDAEALGQWLDAVKKECSETGHLEVAMVQLGQSLIHTPPDPDGLWIHHSAAKALNSKDAEGIRRGFFIGILSSRGAHFVDPTGKPEKELAAGYREKAEAVENAGYHRLATTLRNLAESYEQNAEKIISKEPPFNE